MTEFSDVVIDVNLFPVKSCQAATVNGEPPSRLHVAPTGFEAYGVRDRQYVIIDANPLHDGTYLFTSQRGWSEKGRTEKSDPKPLDPLLATVETDIRPCSLLINSAIGSIVIDTTGNLSTGATRRDVRVHKSVLRNTFDQGPHAAAYFTELLGRPVLLACQGTDPRIVEEMGYRDQASNQVAAADGYPFLLVSQESLDESHRAKGLKLGTVPIDRYRPSLVIAGTGLGPWGEDKLMEVQIGGTTMYVVKACSRCPIPNIDQATGKRVGGGLPILSGHSGFRPGDTDRQSLFGQNMNHVYRPGEYIGVGDELTTQILRGTQNFKSV